MDKKIFNKMHHVYETSNDIYKVTSYWEEYCFRLNKLIQTEPTIDYRYGGHKRGYEVLQSFSASDVYFDDHPNIFKKLFRLALRLFRAGSLYPLLDNYFMKNKVDNYLKFDFEYTKDELLLNNLNINLFPSNNFGNPRDKLDVDGKLYTKNHLYFLRRFNFLYENLDNFKEISTIVELSPGLGQLPDIIFKFNNNSKIILFDLPYQLFFSYTYLSSIFPNKCQYIESYDLNTKLENGKIYFLNNSNISIIKDLGISVDLFINSRSFQEMEEDTVINYMNYVKQNSKYMYLNFHQQLQKSIYSQIFGVAANEKSVQLSFIENLIDDYEKIFSETILSVNKGSIQLDKKYQSAIYKNKNI